MHCAAQVLKRPHVTLEKVEQVVARFLRERSAGCESGPSVGAGGADVDLGEQAGCAPERAMGNGQGADLPRLVADEARETVEISIKCCLPAAP